MAQIQSPETYADGQQVTAARLNNQTNGAILLPGAITDHTNITANTVASGDSILLYDLSATALREANVSDVLGSNLPVTTSAITAGANSDIVVTPNDGVIVTGQAYTSGNGLTVTVTSTAHTLTVGQVILVTAAGAGYNGTFRVATVATNSFTYVMTTAATAGSSTLSYTKKGSVRNAGNESIGGSLFVAGSSVVATSDVTGNQTVAGNQTITGNSTVTGTLAVAGSITNAGTPVQKRVDVAILTREIASGTAYNESVTSTWLDGNFNTITQTSPFVVNSASFTNVVGSAGSATITLPAGTYDIEGHISNVSGGGTGFIVFRVRNETAGTQIKKGNVGKCGGFANGESIVRCITTLAVQTNIKLQYMVSAVGTLNFPISDGTSEQLFIVRITKLA